jgi:hypothetical protein
MRHPRLPGAASAALLALASCSRGPTNDLATNYPQVAGRILSGTGFARTDAGTFVVADHADPATAAARGVDAQLPANGAGATTFSLPGGDSVAVRERGTSGAPSVVGAALAYARPGGTSYWTATETGFEEWIEVDDAGDAAVAQWVIAGASLQQVGDAVVLVDDTGSPILQVSAPEAYRLGGASARAWLRADGDVLSLFTDARGPVLIDPSWTTASAMASVRRYHTATLLPTGKVLVAGGNTTGTTATAAAELFDPATGTWTSAGSMARARYQHTAVLLANGKVLVAGGTNGTSAVATAELYDPVAGTWTSTGALATARQSHAATLLASGKVLVEGGAGPSALASAELYDSAAGTWSSAGSLATARQAHTATLLPSGKVLVAGGAGAAGALVSAELYDPSAGTWSTVAASLATARQNHAAILLATGQVLLAGGLNGTTVLTSAELWNPATGLFATTGSLNSTRQLFPAVLLPSGNVFAAGGFSNSGLSGRTSTELYNPSTGLWSTSSSLATGRGGGTGTVLPSGRVLVAGGSSGTTYYATTTVYDPTTSGSFAATGALSAAREFHAAALLSTGKVLVAGGSSSGPPPTIAALATAQLYDPAAGTWSATGSLTGTRTFHTATPLATGKVLVAAGYDGTNALGTAQLYDPSAGTFAATGALAAARYWHTATLLPSGKVLVAGGTAQTSGGVNPASALGTAELYDPVLGTWSSAGSFTAGGVRYGHTATLLQNGKVLVVGGGNGSASLQTAELYDPATGTWTLTGAPVAARRYHSAALLPNGKVLVVGGYSGAAALATAELYNPQSGTFTATGSLGTARYRAQLLLLQSGAVLIAGGTSSGTNGLTSAQLYDPVAGTWRNTSNSMASRRHGLSLTLLQSGKVLAAGGDSNAGPVTSCDLYDEGRSAPAAAVPTLTSAGSNLPGGAIVLAGTLFTGVSEGAGTGASSSPTDYPIVELTAAGTNAVLFAPFSAFTATSATATLPASAQPGPYLLRVVVNGVPSAAIQMAIYKPLTISAATTTAPPRGAIAFGASGGSQTGYAWSLSTNTSGGSINAATGAYVAGPTGNVTDVVRVQDSLGNVATQSVTVTAGLSISPAAATLAPKASQTFAGSGGSGAGYVWSLSTNASGGSINAASGAYVAGATGSVVDVVTLTDSLGNTATATVSVTAGLSLAPGSVTLAPKASQLFSVTGGSGIGYSWSLVTNASGGSIDAVAGYYTAGPTGSVTDVVQVTDSLGNVATRNVTVTAGLSISPAAASLPPRGSQTFTASGGSGSGLAWSIAVNASGGSINAATGAYVAGATGSVTDVVKVTDSLGNVATRNVTVTAAPSISPATVSLAPRAGQAFSASGGSGGGYAWSLATNASGGSISAATGAYVAGSTGGVTDVVRVTDALGNTATRNVTVGPGVSISPPFASTPPKGTVTFTAAGGSGAGYAWALTTNASGGTILSNGKYTAGSATGTDVVTLTDSLGNTATVTITVTAGVRISPAGADLPPRGSQAFTAIGGSGTGYVWALVANNSGGSINAATGAYVVGPTPGVTDTVQVTDSLGNTATAPVVVGAGVSLAPSGASVPPKGSVSFAASGGSGAGFTWSLTTNASGGSINAATGAYVAGTTPNVTDVVRAVDSLGNTATANVAVGAGVTIAAAGTLPPRSGHTFTASGGSSTGWIWSLSTNASGGSISAATGAYVAGATPGVSDVVRVTDSLGNVATLNVTVGPGVTIAAAGVVPPRGGHAFTASGGSGTGWIWSLTTNASGGSIGVTTGAYVAGATGNVTDVVHVTDSLGNTATVNVTVGPGVSVSPATASVAPRGAQAFTASGGSGSGFTWSLATNASGGAVVAATGAYHAGATGSVTDVVSVVDSLGNSASVPVTVTAGLSVSPATADVRDRTSLTFAASGGSGTGLAWSLLANGSGGSIAPATGAYTAGVAAGTDLVQATDSLGNTATATARVWTVFAAFAFDITSAGAGAAVRATLTVYNDTAAALTVTPPAYAALQLASVAPATGALDPLPTPVAAGASASFAYSLVVTGAPGASYSVAGTAQTGAGPSNVAVTPAGTVADVRVDWAPAALVPPRVGAPYLFSLQIQNQAAYAVTQVRIDNPQPASFTGLAADAATCTSASLGTVASGSGYLIFSGSLSPGAATTLCFLFTGVPSVAQKTSYPFTVSVTRSGGSPATTAYGRTVRIDVPLPDVTSPTVLSNAGGQQLRWVNAGRADAPHDGVVIFRDLAPAVPTLPADYVDYRLSPVDDLLYADAGYSTVASLADASPGVYNYRICNHDQDFVYSNCNSGFWNGQGWLDSAVPTPGGWTDQLGGAIYDLPGVVPGLTVAVATNAPDAVILDAASGDWVDAPVGLSALPSRYTPVAPLADGRTLFFAADVAGTVTALDVSTGSVSWQVFETGESFVAGISGVTRKYAAAAFRAAYASDVLFLGSTSGRLFALNASTGAAYWFVDAGAAIRAATRYDGATNRLYVPTASGIVAYDLGTSGPTQPPAQATGWTRPGGDYRVGCAAGLASTDIACADVTGTVRILDKTTGAVKASLATTVTSPSTLWPVGGSSPGYVLSSAASVQRLLVGGSPLAITVAGEYAPGVTLSPVVVFTSEDSIYVGGSDNMLHKLALGDASDTGLGVAIAPEAAGVTTVQIGPPAYDGVNQQFLFGTDDGRIWAVQKF